ncbi:MAG: alpha,alpha-trehalose-phosphate synthase (UDP-forming) [Thermoanaerobaculia bacterium]
MTSREAEGLRSRLWRALVGPARVRDSVIVIACALVCAGLIFGLLYDLFDGALRRWTDRDLNRRAHLVGVAFQAHGDASPAALARTLKALSASEEAADLVVCASDGSLLATSGIGRQLTCGSELARAALSADGKSRRGTLGERSVVATARSIAPARTLIVLQDRTFLDERRSHLLQIVFVSAELMLLALLLLARAGARIGSRRTEEAARSFVRQMRSRTSGEVAIPPELRLLVRDMHETVEELRNQPPRPEDGAERLRTLVAAEVPSGSLVVIANREPYAHEWTDAGVVVQRPASGLVTGLEPILRASGGTWIAYGGGSADREHSDRMGRVAVPPEAPEYTLRRMWIGDEEYDRYYAGFANEGLWPLCHMAHAQPSFRPHDWVAYQSVNDTFARAAAEETSADGMLLIQDYHFALVPRLVRNRAPHIVTSLFWHIPWPHPEMFGILPWKETLLEGMLGADVVGFHTRQYCLNFLETASRYLECRVNLDEMSIAYGGHRTVVRPYPISVEWPYPAASRTEGAALRQSLRIPAAAHVSVGVDRADYTKGLVERVAGIELMLEENPSMVGRFVFVQLASPTRTSIRRYRQLADDLNEIVARVNSRFATTDWTPILLQMRTFSPDEVRRYYAMADSALVTPLQDGMNLVAKEYVAACEDGDGVLVLSELAGAAKELDGALLVNPYDTEQVAQAILRAVRMPLAERRARMQAMREQIATHSIYDWSERLLMDMRDIRQERARFWPRRHPATATPTAREVVAG